MLLEEFLNGIPNSEYKNKLKQIVVNGIPITIEQEIGSIRNGIKEDGTKWSTKFKTRYGFINNVNGVDNDELDCFVGNDQNANMVYIIHQRLEDGFDEDKCMIGFKTMGDAKKCYLQHVDDPAMLGTIIPISVNEFKKMYGII